jgi:hypothetical protein
MIGGRPPACWRRTPGSRGRYRASAGQRGAARGERVFRQRDRPDPEVVISFVDAYDFAAGLVLRVLDAPESTYYEGAEIGHVEVSQRTASSAISGGTVCPPSNSCTSVVMSAACNRGTIRRVVWSIGNTVSVRPWDR